MPKPSTSPALDAQLRGPDVLELARQADTLRRERFGDEASFCLVRSLPLGSGLEYSALSGAPLPPGGPVASLDDGLDIGDALLERAHPAAGDYQLLLPRGGSTPSLDQRLALVAAAAGALRELSAGAPENVPTPTLQLDTAGGWMQALSAANIEPAAGLGAAADAGLRLLSDGVRPEIHPLHGPESAEQWRACWRGAAEAGLKGNAVVLYGPGHDLDAVLAQIRVIDALQRECGVFQSVAPLIYDDESFGGAADGLLSQGQNDLRVLAACRLGLASIPHLRMMYARSDLKMAHLSLACGVDDLEGPLFDGLRDKKADAEAMDLSLDEMGEWLGEAGFSPVLRNGVFEPAPIDEANPS